MYPIGLLTVSYLVIAMTLIFVNLAKQGISLSKSGKKYEAKIMINGKIIFIGSYSTLEEAQKARQQAEIKYFGEFAYVKQ